MKQVTAILADAQYVWDEKSEQGVDEWKSSLEAYAKEINASIEYKEEEVSQVMTSEEWSLLRDAKVAKIKEMVVDKSNYIEVLNLIKEIL